MGITGAVGGDGQVSSNIPDVQGMISDSSLRSGGSFGMGFDTSDLLSFFGDRVQFGAHFEAGSHFCPSMPKAPFSGSQPLGKVTLCYGATPKLTILARADKDGNEQKGGKVTIEAGAFSLPLTWEAPLVYSNSNPLRIPSTAFSWLPIYGYALKLNASLGERPLSALLTGKHTLTAGIANMDNAYDEHFAPLFSWLFEGKNRTESAGDLDKFTTALTLIGPFYKTPTETQADRMVSLVVDFVVRQKWTNLALSGDVACKLDHNLDYKKTAVSCTAYGLLQYYFHNHLESGTRIEWASIFSNDPTLSSHVGRWALFAGWHPKYVRGSHGEISTRNPLYERNIDKEPDGNPKEPGALSPFIRVELYGTVTTNAAASNVPGGMALITGGLQFE
jgi:hypothetical protein